MFTKTTLAAIALAVSAGAAFATDGATQLSRNVGVEPGTYSLVDLVALKGADADTQSRKAVSYILENGTNGTVSRGASDLSNIGDVADNAQLSNNVGVTSGTLSTAALTSIKSAQNDDNDEAARFFANGGLASNTGFVANSSPAHQQLASGLNVDAADYTLAELIILRDAVQTNDTSLVRAIVK